MVMALEEHVNNLNISTGQIKWAPFTGYDKYGKDRR